MSEPTVGGALVGVGVGPLRDELGVAVGEFSDF